MRDVGVVLATMLAGLLVGAPAAATGPAPGTGPAVAEDDEQDEGDEDEGDEDEGPSRGELEVDMNVAFADVYVDGEEWSSVNFTRDGERAHVEQLPLEEPLPIRMVPSEGGYGEVEFEIAREDFEKDYRGDGTYVLVSHRDVSFPEKKKDDDDDDDESERDDEGDGGDRKVVPPPDPDEGDL